MTGKQIELDETSVVSSITCRHCGLDPQSHYNVRYHAIALRLGGRNDEARFALSAMTIRYLNVDTTLIGIMLLLLLATTVPVVSQSVTIDVSNESLNNVLNRIGLEISFDDAALSVYDVTVSKTFAGPVEALTYLLEDKPFHVEKIGNIHVIISQLIQPAAEIHPVFQDATMERFVFTGTVVSHADGKPLQYVAVSLLDINNQLLIAGVTDATGRFTIQSTRIPAMIKISHIGYETMLSTIERLKRELGVIALNEKVVELSEIIVTGDNHRPEVNHYVYNITPEMRYGVDNALELLDKIPGVSYDIASNTVRVNQHANILFLVDGIQYSYSYLKHLSPHRIRTVEVITTLSGRYLSDDYAGIVKFDLKKDYTGYEIHFINNTALNLSKTAEKSRLAESRPSIGFIYTTRKLNIFGTYDYNRENSNLHTSKSLTYPPYKLASQPAAKANNSFQQDNHVISSGLNYHITPLHLLGFQADYASGKTHTLQEYTMQRKDLSDNYEKNLTNQTYNILQAYTFVGSVFYRGQITNRLHLFGDVSYNFYKNFLSNLYIQDNDDFLNLDLWTETKNQATLNLEGKYNLSKTLTIESGYSNIWRQYTTISDRFNEEPGYHNTYQPFSDYYENRNKAYAYLNWFQSDKFSMKAGVAIENIWQQYVNNAKNYLRILPYARLNCTISKAVGITVNYVTSQSYPALYRISPINIVIDTFLVQTGNPEIKSAIRHQAFAEISLWNKLRISPQINFINDGISEVYAKKDNRLYRTFGNINFREYNLHASYNQTVGKYVNFKNAVWLYHHEALNEGVQNSLNGWTLRSEVDYYNPNTDFGVQLGYSRNMRKNILWQGYQMSDKDYWFVTAQKEFWQNRIGVSMTYIPPVSFGVRYDRIKEIDTPLYKEKTVSNLFSYSQMLLLKVSFRLERGSKKPSESRTDRITNERE